VSRKLGLFSIDIQPEALFEEFITAYIRQGRLEELKGVSGQLNEA
jgi:hypothetical protein